MGEEVFISCNDIEDYMNSYACGSSKLAPTICGVPADVVDGPGLYVFTDYRWVKFS